MEQNNSIAERIKEWLEKGNRLFWITLLCLIGYAGYQELGSSKKAVPPEPPGVLVTAEEWGERWAFKVDRGYVYNIDGAAVFEKVDGNIYQLNGVARTRGYRPLERIWRNQPEPLFEGQKVNIGPFIKLALKTPK